MSGNFIHPFAANNHQVSVPFHHLASGINTVANQNGASHVICLFTGMMGHLFWKLTFLIREMFVSGQQENNEAVKMTLMT